MHRSILLIMLATRLAVAAPHHDGIPGAADAQPGLGELVDRASARLTAAYARLVDRLPATIPDLSILTTDPVANTESSGYGWRDDPIRHDPRFHSGTDFRAKPGTPVVAAGDGVVVFCGRQSGYGNVIYIDHGGGVVTRYAHLRKIETKKDAMLVAGDRIGQVGSTGRTTGPHLHFEIRLDGRAVDPVTAMTVAELERESPAAGRLATFALAPELQAHARDRQDQATRHKASRPGRPDRPNQAKHTQVLW